MWYRPIIPALLRLRQVDFRVQSQCGTYCEFPDNLNCIVRLCLQNKAKQIHKLKKDWKKDIHLTSLNSPYCSLNTDTQNSTGKWRMRENGEPEREIQKAPLSLPPSLSFSFLSFSVYMCVRWERKRHRESRRQRDIQRFRDVDRETEMHRERQREKDIEVMVVFKLLFPLLWTNNGQEATWGEGYFGSQFERIQSIMTKKALADVFAVRTHREDRKCDWAIKPQVLPLGTRSLQWGPIS